MTTVPSLSGTVKVCALPVNVNTCSNVQAPFTHVVSSGHTSSQPAHRALVPSSAQVPSGQVPSLFWVTHRCVSTLQAASLQGSVGCVQVGNFFEQLQVFSPVLPTHLPVLH
jgi:hypothetical protein